MRARHGQHVAAPLQHVLGQPLGPETWAGQRRGWLPSAGSARPRDDIADHEHIGLERQLVGAKASISSMPRAWSWVLMGG